MAGSGGSRRLARLHRAVGHPVATARRLARRLDERALLPAGRTAGIRTLLRGVRQEGRRTLVIGPPHVVRRAWPDAILDVVGTRAADEEVTVVSDALGDGSLPRRWECVVVTDVDPSSDRLVAAASACLPGGAVISLGTGSGGPPHPAGTDVEHRARSGGIGVVVSRVRA